MGSHTLKQLKSYSFDEIKNLFETTIRRVHTFVLIESESERVIPKLAARSSKRDAKEELVQESSKRQKTGESSELVEETKDKEKEEMSQERIQQMMIIVPEQGMNIIRVGNHTEVYQFFDDMLKAFDIEDLVKLWSLVKEKFISTDPTEDKERELWNLYVCGDHYVSTEDGIDIYMLVDREYPLSRGTLTLMLVAKLLMEQDSEMSRELLRKIFMQVNSEKLGFVMKPYYGKQNIRFMVSAVKVMTRFEYRFGIGFLINNVANITVVIPNVNAANISPVDDGDLSGMCISASMEVFSSILLINAALAVLIAGASQSRQHDTLARLPMDIRLKIDLGKSVGVLRCK
ncbi:hypothetical protein Tco_1386142 [Tanacetum coccineum]